MSIGSIMDTARQGLYASQFGIELVGRNISNSATEGYSRQEVTFQNPSSGGVNVWSVRSAIDGFVEGRITQEVQTQGRLSAESQLLGETSLILGTTETGLDVSLGGFFASLSALATTPDGVEERANVLFQAEAVATELNTEASVLQKLSVQVDQQLGTSIGRVNQLAADISELNSRLNGVPASDGSDGQLADLRTRMVNELSGLIEVNSFVDGNNNVNLFVGGGVPLVEGVNGFKIVQTTATGFSAHQGLAVEINSGQQIDISDRIGSGAIGGMLRVRDDVIDVSLAEIDRIAAALSLNVNRVHSQGFGLDGSTGNDVFSPIQSTTTNAAENTGQASVSSSIFDLNAVTLDDYEVFFTAPGQFDLLNVTQGTTVSSGVVYSSGMTLNVGGVSITLADGASGPAAGDRFSISTSKNQAANTNVVLTDRNQIAASQSLAGIPGDNQNALALSALETTKLLDNGTLTLGDKFARIGARVGSELAAADSALEAQSLVMESLQLRRAATSGVSLDEEAANLIKFQNSYQANAQLLRVADELLDIIINMV
jgi:flagellar hook-associated protein 1 FlgK